MGKHFTYAVLQCNNEAFTGVTLTPHAEGDLCNIEIGNVTNFLQKAQSSYDIATRACALALINAIGQHAIARSCIKASGNLRDNLAKFLLLNTNQSDNIVFIGHLQPVVNTLKQQRKTVNTFCRTRTDSKNAIYNDIFEYEALQRCDVAVITGASLIGSTIDAMLRFCQGAKLVILAGFSAGAHPSWYKDVGITHVASMHTQDIVMQKCQEKMENIFLQPCYIEQIR
ncbi:MAG: Rossmann-like domain-containing protein [Campylobacterota bacterium]